MECIICNDKSKYRCKNCKKPICSTVCNDKHIQSCNKDIFTKGRQHEFDKGTKEIPFNLDSSSEEIFQSQIPSPEASPIPMQRSHTDDIQTSSAFGIDPTSLSFEGPEYLISSESESESGSDTDIESFSHYTKTKKTDLSKTDILENERSELDNTISYIILDDRQYELDTSIDKELYIYNNLQESANTIRDKSIFFQIIINPLQREIRLFDHPSAGLIFYKDEMTDSKITILLIRFNKSITIDDEIYIYDKDSNSIIITEQQKDDSIYEIYQQLDINCIYKESLPTINILDTENVFLKTDLQDEIVCIMNRFSILHLVYTHEDITDFISHEELKLLELFPDYAALISLSEYLKSKSVCIVVFKDMYIKDALYQNVLGDDKILGFMVMWYNSKNDYYYDIVYNMNSLDMHYMKNNLDNFIGSIMQSLMTMKNKYIYPGSMGNDIKLIESNIITKYPRPILRYGFKDVQIHLDNINTITREELIKPMKGDIYSKYPYATKQTRTLWNILATMIFLKDNRCIELFERLPELSTDIFPNAPERANTPLKALCAWSSINSDPEFDISLYDVLIKNGVLFDTDAFDNLIQSKNEHPELFFKVLSGILEKNELAKYSIKNLIKFCDITSTIPIPSPMFFKLIDHLHTYKYISYNMIQEMITTYIGKYSSFGVYHGKELIRQNGKLVIPLLYIEQILEVFINTGLLPFISMEIKKEILHKYTLVTKIVMLMDTDKQHQINLLSLINKSTKNIEKLVKENSFENFERSLNLYKRTIHDAMWIKYNLFNLNIFSGKLWKDKYPLFNPYNPIIEYTLSTFNNNLSMASITEKIKNGDADFFVLLVYAENKLLFDIKPKSTQTKLQKSKQAVIDTELKRQGKYINRRTVITDTPDTSIPRSNILVRPITSVSKTPKPRRMAPTPVNPNQPLAKGKTGGKSKIQETDLMNKDDGIYEDDGVNLEDFVVSQDEDSDYNDDEYSDDEYINIIQDNPNLIEKIPEAYKQIWKQYLHLVLVIASYCLGYRSQVHEGKFMLLETLDAKHIFGVIKDKTLHVKKKRITSYDDTSTLLMTVFGPREIDMIDGKYNLISYEKRTKSKELMGVLMKADDLYLNEGSSQSDLKLLASFLMGIKIIVEDEKLKKTIDFIEDTVLILKSIKQSVSMIVKNDINLMDNGNINDDAFHKFERLIDEEVYGSEPSSPVHKKQRHTKDSDTKQKQTHKHRHHHKTHISRSKHHKKPKTKPEYDPKHQTLAEMEVEFSELKKKLDRIRRHKSKKI